MMIAILKGWSDTEPCVKSSPKIKPPIITKMTKNRAITMKKTRTKNSTKLFFTYKYINFHYFSNSLFTIIRKIALYFVVQSITTDLRPADAQQFANGRNRLHKCHYTTSQLKILIKFPNNQVGCDKLQKNSYMTIFGHITRLSPVG